MGEGHIGPACCNDAPQFVGSSLCLNNGSTQRRRQEISLGKTSGQKIIQIKIKRNLKKT